MGEFIIKSSIENRKDYFSSEQVKKNVHEFLLNEMSKKIHEVTFNKRFVPFTVEYSWHIKNLHREDVKITLVARII